MSGKTSANLDHRKPSSHETGPPEMFQALAPSKKKLSSVDASRVLSVLDNTIRRSELMACLEVTICRTATKDGFSMILGADLVNLLESYEVLLEFFYDVAASQYKTADAANNDLLLHFSSSESISVMASPADKDNDDSIPVPFRSVTTQQSAIKSISASILPPSSSSKSLLLVDGSRSSRSMSIAISPSHEESEGSDAEQSGMDVVRSSDEEFSLSTRANAGSAKQTPGVSATFSPTSKAFTSRNVHKEAGDSSCKEQFAGALESIFSDTSTLLNASPSGDHNKRHTRFDSPSNFGVKVTGESAGRRRLKSFDSQRYNQLKTAMTNYDYVRRDMEAMCRQLLRLYRANPLAVNKVLKKAEMAPGTKAYIGLLKQLRHIMNQRLLTTPLDTLQMKEYLEDLEKEIEVNNRKERQLLDELQMETNRKVAEVERLNEIINDLIQELVLVDHMSKEFLKQTEEDSEKDNRYEERRSFSRVEKLLLESTTLRGQLLKVRREYWDSETVLRKKKYQLETEIDSRIRAYDSEMTQLQDEFDEVSAEYRIEKEQLEDIEERFAIIDVEFQSIMVEREEAYRAIELKQREELRHQRSARAIQAWWRAYLVRKAVDIRAKKLAKLAKKAAKLARRAAKKEKTKKSVAAVSDDAAPTEVATNAAAAGSKSATATNSADPALAPKKSRSR